LLIRINYPGSDPYLHRVSIGIGTVRGPHINKVSCGVEGPFPNSKVGSSYIRVPCLKGSSGSIFIENICCPITDRLIYTCGPYLNPCCNRIRTTNYWVSPTPISPKCNLPSYSRTRRWDSELFIPSFISFKIDIRASSECPPIYPRYGLPWTAYRTIIPIVSQNSINIVIPLGLQ
jgi:hypothetical protein